MFTEKAENIARRIKILSKSSRTHREIKIYKTLKSTAEDKRILSTEFVALKEDDSARREVMNALVEALTKSAFKSWDSAELPTRKH